MDKRDSKISLEDYCKTKKLEDLAVVGTIHPLKGINKESMQVEDDVVHFRYIGFPDWGVTFPRMNLLEAVERNLKFGYFHVHGDEMVYIKPYLFGGNNKRFPVPCYECELAIIQDCDI